MPICPKCKENVEFLKQVDSGIEKCHIFFNKKKDYLDWEQEEFESDGIVRLFYCPECNEELDFDEQQAEEFLREKDELKEIVTEKLKQIEDRKK